MYGNPRRSYINHYTNTYINLTLTHILTYLLIRVLTLYQPMYLLPIRPGVYGNPRGPRPPIDLTAVAIYSSQGELFVSLAIHPTPGDRPMTDCLTDD